MEQMQQIEAIASALSGGTLSRAEKSGLYTELADEENVYALVVGTATQKGPGPLVAQVAELGERHLVALTDQRLVLLVTSDGGIKPVASHPREEVKSVRLRPGVGVSEVEVIIGGVAAWVIASVAAMDAQRFVETARDALHLPATIGDEPADAESAAERELKELKRMLDEGTITRDEYEQLRKPILERMGYQEEDEEEKSKTGIIVGAIIAVLVVILLIWWMLASGGDDEQDELGEDEEVTDETQQEDQDEAPADQGGADEGAGEQPGAPAQQAPAEEPPADQPQDQPPPVQQQPPQEPEDEAAEDEDDGFWPGWPWEWDIFEEEEDQAEEEAPVQEEPEQDELGDDGPAWPWEEDGAWPWEDEGQWPWE